MPALAVPALPAGLAPAEALVWPGVINLVAAVFAFRHLLALLEAFAMSRRRRWRVTLLTNQGWLYPLPLNHADLFFLRIGTLLAEGGKQRDNGAHYSADYRCADHYRYDRVVYGHSLSVITHCVCLRSELAATRRRSGKRKPQRLRLL